MRNTTDWESPTFDKNGLTKWQWMVQYREKFHLGKNTDIGAFTYMNAFYGIIIEDYVQIGSHCSLYTLSTIDNKVGQILLKRNCRIGSHTTIMPGVTIGENSIIGANSFVNKDIPPNVLAYGIPAKVIRELSEKEKNIP